MADGSAHTVVPCVAAPDNDHIFPLGLHIFFISKCGVKQALCICLQEINCKIDPLRVPSWSLDVPGIGRAAGKHHPVKVVQELIRLYIPSHIHTGNKGNAFLLHDLTLPLHDPLFQLHVGNAVHQQPAHTVGALEHRHLVPPPVKLVRRRKPGGAAAYDRHSLAGAHLGWLRCRIPLGISVFNDGIFVFLCCHRLPVQAAGTGRLAQGRTHP